MALETEIQIMRNVLGGPGRAFMLHFPICPLWSCLQLSSRISESSLSAINKKGGMSFRRVDGGWCVSHCKGNYLPSVVCVSLMLGSEGEDGNRGRDQKL